ncbi:hypothetical protein CEV33_4629 [Brucella grignonensis]|uniref:Uncharacterized protein n=1 Tax=Brucella grignonensis TaxID=94627 RepID=A0A256GD72_9HYPH|nr:hypothetical protein CEV33_4629 [Brucella grignonensis]
MIQQALGDLVRAPLTEIRTIEQMMAERPAREKEDPGSEIPPEIAEQVVHQFMDRQYREILDQPLGMLGNKTPRQAAKSASGRQKLAEWLKYSRKSIVPAAKPGRSYGDVQFRVDVARTRRRRSAPITATVYPCPNNVLRPISAAPSIMSAARASIFPPSCSPR